MEGTSARRLRELTLEDCLPIPGAPMPLALRMIERMGFPAAYLSGAAFSAGQLALPDIGLFTLTELVEQTARMTAVSSIPLIVDADTGFGDAANVERTVYELSRAGAAAIQIEDQVLPKRCGHLSGKSLVPAAAMCAKIRTAVGVREDRDLVLIARTDARAIEGLDRAIERAEAYIDAGADWIFVEALEEVAEFERVADRLDVPLVANMTEFGKSPLVPLGELAEMGYAAVLYPVTLLRIAMRAMEAALGILATEETQKSLLDLMQTREELYELLDYQGYEARDKRFFSGGSDA